MTSEDGVTGAQTPLRGYQNQEVEALRWQQPRLTSVVLCDRRITHKAREPIAVARKSFENKPISPYTEDNFTDPCSAARHMIASVALHERPA